MAKLTFVGGIHPYDGKDLSKDKPIQDVLPKGEMVYPVVPAHRRSGEAHRGKRRPGAGRDKR